MQIDLKALCSVRTFLRTVVPAMSLAVCAVGAAHAKGNVDKGLDFDNPSVLDLAERSQKVAGAPIAVVALAPADANAILTATELGEELPPLGFSDDLFGCKTPVKSCSQQNEAKLLALAGTTVKRDGKHLSVVPATGAALNFVDWNEPQSKTSDGDEETHWYLGRLEGSGYHRVEVDFGQDAPGDFLINAQSGKVAFIHNGSDVAALAPDGMHLVTFNTLNLPLTVRVAALDAAGPRLTMQCEAAKGGELVTAQFKGWHDARSFDLGIVVKHAGNKLEQQFAVRVAHGASGWNLATNDQAQLTAIGFGCNAAEPW
jgi:hypothetical protein